MDFPFVGTQFLHNAHHFMTTEQFIVAVTVEGFEIHHE
jgi:hypothetical protein